MRVSLPHSVQPTAIRPGDRQARWAAILLLVAPIALLVAVPLVLTKQTDPDYWWHVRTGELIVETGRIPRTDPFSFTASGRPWITHEWLTQVLFYAVQSTVGYVGNVALFGLFGGGAFIATYAACREWGAGELAATLLALGALYLGSMSLNVRPQIFTTLLLALTALVLTRHRHGKPGPLWALPPLFALWVNLHGGYVIGLALLGVTLVTEAIARLPTNPLPAVRPLLVAALASLAAVLVNPHGVEALAYPVTYAGTQNASMQFIAEWQSPDFHSPALWPLAGSIALLMVMGLARAPLGLTETLWALMFALMALTSVRHIQLYGVVVAPLLAARAQAELPLLRRTTATWRHPGLLAALWPVLLVASATGVARAHAEGVPLQVHSEPSERGYPAGGAAYLQQTDAQGNLFNEYEWGGYLIYALHPERRVFIDGRADLYGDEWVEEHTRIVRLQADWGEVTRQHDIRLALVKKGGPLAALLDCHPEWAEVYAGEVERLFVRGERAGQVGAPGG